MNTYQILTGQKINQLSVIEVVYRSRAYYLRCLCDCGEEKVIKAYDVVNGKSKSCGCGRTNVHTIIHGCAGSNKTPEYTAWKNIKSRCYNSKHEHYKNYGGRGITVCDRWLSSFENFLADVGLRPSNNYTIERTNNNGNYEPDNCKWATRREQANNKRNSFQVTFNGQTKSISDWSDELGFSRQVLYKRYMNTGVQNFDKPLNYHKS